VAYRLDTHERRTLIRGGAFPRFVPTGYLAYYRAGAIMAVPLDVTHVEVRGTPAPVLEGVSGTGTGAAQFSFSALGMLVYLRGGAAADADLGMVWVDRKGNEQPLPAPPHAYADPRISPDGQRVAEDINESSRDIWIYDLMRNTLTRLTSDGINLYPIWAPDGRRIAYRSQKSAGSPNLFWQPTDGSGGEERLTTSQFLQNPTSFSPDGKVLSYFEQEPETGYDIWTLPLAGERKPQVFLRGPFSERGLWLSPDGHWGAYVSDETGQFEVYVQPFPGTGGKRQISTDGGTEIVWSPKGNELFYRSGSQREKVMAVDIQTKPTFSAGTPHTLFEGPYTNNLTSTATTADYAVSLDGQRFLMLKAKATQQTAAPTQINVVQNWFEELKRRVPTGTR
jgi:serine/threonine-protein kinase